jgi:hypothetical protein
MDKAKWQMPHRNDMYVGDEKKRWLRTDKVEKEDGTIQRVILLEKCEVDDPDRLGYWNGEWFRAAKA